MFETFPDVLSVADICSALGIGRTKAYELVNTGQLRSLRIGNAIRIPKTFLLDYISAQCYTGNEADKRRYTGGGIHEGNG